MNNKPFITLPTLSGVELVHTSVVTHICSDERSCIFYFENGKQKTVNIQIGKVEEILDNDGFIRIHQKCIINLYKVKEIYTACKGLMLVGDKELSISRGYKENFRKKLEKYCHKIINGL